MSEWSDVDLISFTAGRIIYRNRVYDMRALRTCLLASISLFTAVRARAAEPATVPACAPAGITYTRTTLYFGLARPAGTISEREWKAFVRDEVMPRFPQGFTIWQADGQWRGADGRTNRERAKVLLI